jgi:hypothetical protein
MIPPDADQRGDLRGSDDELPGEVALRLVGVPVVEIPRSPE